MVINSVLLVHVVLLSLGSLKIHLHGDLFLGNGYTQVAKVSVYLDFCFVLTVSSTWAFSAISLSVYSSMFLLVILCLMM